MSILRVAAELLQRAAQDENYTIDLQAAIADETVRAALVSRAIDPRDLPVLSPGQWLWFARWRQSAGGPLDLNLLRYLDAGGLVGSREARFRLRGLAIRDPRTVQLAAYARAADPEFDDAGLIFLLEHANSYPNPLEVARDALQYATPAAWFTLRALTSSPDRDRRATVIQFLSQLAEVRDLSADVQQQWYEAAAQ